MPSNVTIPASGTGDATPKIATVQVTGTSAHKQVVAVSQSGDTEAEYALDSAVGGLTEAAPGTDTASSGLNGRLQRIAQRLTSLIALLPSSLGQKTKAASLAVTLASDQDALPVTDNGGSLTVDGTVAVSSLPANASVNQAQVAGTATDTNSGNKSAGTQRIVIATDQPALTNALKVDGSAVTQPVSGTVTANAGSGTFATKETRSATATSTNVSVTNANTNVLASNANRLGATIYNDSSVAALVKLGATATTTSFTVKLNQDDYYEVPFGYTGNIDAITAASTSTLRVVELT